MGDILILTAAYGMGHNSVSKALKEYIEIKNKNVIINIEDLFDIINPKIKNLGSKIYSNLTENYPLVYNTIYDIKKTNKNNIIDGVICSVSYKKLYSYLEKTKPKVIISTFPLCSCLVSKIKKEYNYNVSLITVITDVVDSWEWIYDKTNMYLVPSIEIKERLVAKGIRPEIIIPSGIPIKRNFLNTASEYKNKDKLLIVASGMNYEEITNDFLRELDCKTPLKTVIVTGRNKKLYDKLCCKEYKNIMIYGFVDNIDTLMDESVYIVTKPGGVTLFEAIWKELPLIIIDSRIGQEKGNVDYIRQKKIGVVINDITGLLDIIDFYVRYPGVIDTICYNLRNIKNNLNFNKVADYVLYDVI